jgi:hypothetical protein
MSWLPFTLKLSGLDSISAFKKERERSVSEHDFPTLAEHDGRRYAIKEAPPLIFHHPLINLESNRANVQQVLARYRNSLADDLKILFDRYRLMDLSLKVVGVGSAGTLCDIALMLAAKNDPLLFGLQPTTEKVEIHPSSSPVSFGAREVGEHWTWP